MTVYIKAKGEMQLPEWKRETLHTGLIYIYVQVYAPKNSCTHKISPPVDLRATRHGSLAEIIKKEKEKKRRRKKKEKKIKSVDSTAEKNPYYPVPKKVTNSVPTRVPTEQHKACNSRSINIQMSADTAALFELFQ